MSEDRDWTGHDSAHLGKSDIGRYSEEPVEMMGAHMGKGYISKPGEPRPLATVKEYELTAQFVQESRPKFWKLICPRRYAPPAGYANPKIHSISMAAHLISNQRDADLNKVLVDCLLTDWKLIELGAPTFFVGADFISDLMITDPPEDMQLKDILWPHDAMVFMLPESFQKAFFGYRVPFITVCRTPTGKVEPPKVLDGVCDQYNGLGLGYAGSHGVIATATVFFGMDYGIDYSASYSGEDLIAKIYQEHTFHDDTQQWIRDGMKKEGVALTAEQDVQMVQKIIGCAIQLVLAMAEIPEYLAPGPTVARPERKDHKGRIVKEELWQARMFGGNYVMDRIPKSGAWVGSHASPRIHRRRGHWRRQIGWRELPEGVKAKTTWIKPMWVGK
jgi:hypothetical protein